MIISGFLPSLMIGSTLFYASRTSSLGVRCLHFPLLHSCFPWLCLLPPLKGWKFTGTCKDNSSHAHWWRHPPSPCLMSKVPLYTVEAPMQDSLTSWRHPPPNDSWCQTIPMPEFPIPFAKGSVNQDKDCCYHCCWLLEPWITQWGSV